MLRAQVAHSQDVTATVGRRARLVAALRASEIEQHPVSDFATLESGYLSILQYLNQLLDVSLRQLQDNVTLVVQDLHLGVKGGCLVLGHENWLQRKHVSQRINTLAMYGTTLA